MGTSTTSTYYSYFDTVVNAHLIEAGGLDVDRAPVFGVAVETRCRFRHSLSFPEVLDAGLRVARVGTQQRPLRDRPVRRGLGAPAAVGHFVHVYVDRGRRRPAPVPEERPKRAGAAR